MSPASGLRAYAAATPAGYSVMPGGLATNYWFEYGPTTSYGSVTTTTSAGSGRASSSAATVSRMSFACWLPVEM